MGEMTQPDWGAYFLLGSRRNIAQMLKFIHEHCGQLP